MWCRVPKFGAVFFLNISLAMTCSLASWIVWVYRVLEKREGGEPTTPGPPKGVRPQKTHTDSLSHAGRGTPHTTHHKPHTPGSGIPACADRYAGVLFWDPKVPRVRYVVAWRTVWDSGRMDIMDE